MARQSKRDAILSAFIEMVESMPLEEVRVEELIRRSGVSKTTFYRFFRDKYDVMNAVYLDISKAITSSNTDLSQMHRFVREDFQIIYRHPRYFRRILDFNGQNSFRETIRDYYRGNILRQVVERSGGEPLSARMLFEIDAYSETAAFIVIWWILNDCALPPEELASYSLDCIPLALRPYFNLPDTPV